MELPISHDTITKFDTELRIVSIANLEAMCAKLKHYSILKFGKSRVTVLYSGPKTVDAVTVVYPVVPNTYEPKNPLVVLLPIRCLDASGSSNYGLETVWPGGQVNEAFQDLHTSPELTRTQPHSKEWKEAKK